MASGKITFAVRGRRQQVEVTPEGDEVETVLVGVARGDAQESLLRAEPNRDVVKLELVNGPELILHPDTARELFRAQARPRGARGRSVASEGRAGDDLEQVEVPTRLAWPEAATARGDDASGEVALRSFRLVRETVSSKGANLVGAALGDWFESRLDEGLYRLFPDELVLTKERKLEPGQPLPLSGKKRALILLHGSFSSTGETFAKLWTHATRLQEVFRHFEGQVYGFEHATLTKGPIENALALADHLPNGAEIHFLTHSRGGLVAEALAQLVATQQLGERDLRAFADKRYERQREALTALHRKLVGRGIQVRRIVRVACPTRGSLLASGRLDAYLSILKWTLEVAGVQPAASLVSFLHEVAKRRTKPEELPGLEAMMPERSFIRWLHRSDEPIDGDVRVVAGDIEGDTVVSWLKTLLSDAFYWTDNDLIVQTRSMYGGAPRKGDALFYLDRGAAVSHFSYFANQTTAVAIVNALIASGERPAQFAVLGPQSSRGLDSSGIRGRTQEATPGPAPELPAVLLLPGILGSHLKVGEERVWLTWRMINGLDRLAYSEEGGPVVADGPRAACYDDLVENLRRGAEPRYEVIPFAYDWRRSIEAEAVNLAPVVSAALAARRETQQPVHILAHSMGGLVARALEFAAPDVWRRFVAQPNGRLLMLGTPHAGSWVPMQVLSGDHLLGGLLSSVGALFDVRAARGIFADLPGFLQLQADLARFKSPAAWRELEQKDRQIWSQTVLWHNLDVQWQANAWGIPSEAVLASAIALRKKLDSQQFDAATAKRMVVVVGSARSTPGAVYYDDAGVRYQKLSDGDGTVPLASALLPSVAAYRCDAAHDELTRRSSLFGAYRDLLRSGFTSALTRVVVKRAARGLLAPGDQQAPQAGVPLPRRAMRGFAPEVPDALDTSISLSERDAGLEEPLEVSVVNGNLTFINQALLLGHYRSQALTGTEKVMDRLIGDTMSRALALDDYPQDLGANKAFLNLHRALHDPFAMPRPKSVIVVGMGDEGELRGVPLMRAITRAVVSYAQGLIQSLEERVEGFELAATLLGSGGMGMTVATSAVSVAQGVCHANAKLRAWNLPTVSCLRIIELYEDRATEALRALAAARERTPRAFSVEPVLTRSHGGLPRPEDASYRGADYDMISVTRVHRDEPKASAEAKPGAPVDKSFTIAFTIDTKRARTESSETTHQPQLLRNLVKDAESRLSARSLGRTLFRVLVPREMDAYFGTSEAVVLEVDETTAPIPWELLDPDGDREQSPWAVRCKLLRKLKSQTYRYLPRSASRDAHVLVIGNPLCDTKWYPPLEGAEAEAKAVASLFGVEPLLNQDAATLVGALFDEPYRVVHIAGHGKEDGSGVVLSDDMVLNSELIERVDRVPDLVFVNCCHSARQELEVGDSAPVRHWDRPKLAAAIAGQLIRIGVRCVIATGWAVDDDAAQQFSLEFYRRLKEGDRFIDAVSAARERIWRDFPNQTWAAYQCYGDPDWVLTEATGRTRSHSAAKSEPSLASPSALLVALATLADRGESAEPEERRELIERLGHLDQHYQPLWGDLGSVAEGFALAYRNLGSCPEHLDKAMDWYTSAVNAEDGSASQRAIENLCNLRSRRAADRVADAFESELEAKQFAALVERERAEILPSIEALDHLSALQRTNGNGQSKARPTYERANLLSSAWKRLAMIWQLAELKGVPEAGAQATQAIVKVIESCRAAEQRGRELQVKNLHYAQLTRMSAELVQSFRNGQVRTNAEEIASVAESIERLDRIEPSFWTQAQRQELKVHQALGKRDLKSVMPDLDRELAKLYERLTLPSSWASVRDQTRFLIWAYRPRADDAERSAADQLLSLLEGYAWQA